MHTRWRFADVVAADLRPGGQKLYLYCMIAVKAENDRLLVTIPTQGMTPTEISDFVSWLRTESALRCSRLSQEAGWKLSEGVKSSWWQENQDRFASPDSPEGAD